MLCRFYLIGCVDRQCARIHDPAKLRPTWCNKDCVSDRRRADAQPPWCPHFHKNEKTPRDEIVRRAIEAARPVTRAEVFRRTRLCTGCPNPRVCDDAHSESERVPLVCPYGSLCPGATCAFHTGPKPATSWRDRARERERPRSAKFARLPGVKYSNERYECWADDDTECDFSVVPIY
jgi:hypothetical protein